MAREKKANLNKASHLSPLKKRAS